MSYIEYKDLVCQLFNHKQYPILLNHIILELYYKEMETNDVGITYSKYNHDPETIYNQINDPYILKFLTDNGNYFNLHKQNCFNFNINGLPLKCMRIKIYKNDAINKILNLKCVTFEEEIYHFITYLNYDIPKIKNLLNLNFIQCTQLIPMALKLKICNYKITNMSGTYKNPDCFGPNGDILQVRLLEGRLSDCNYNNKIMSLRDHYKFQEYLKKKHR